MPDAGLLPADRIQRAHCRSICGEIHSGFTTLRASLPVNLKGHFPGFKIWSRAQADIDRVCTIWRECLAESGGHFCSASAAWRTRCTPPSSPAS
jgi:glutathione S-transferase